VEVVTIAVGFSGCFAGHFKPMTKLQAAVTSVAKIRFRQNRRLRFVGKFGFILSPQTSFEFNLFRLNDRTLSSVCQSHA
jgi:hypothetical protein